MPDFTEVKETAKRMQKCIEALDDVIELHLDNLIDRDGAQYFKEELRRRKKRKVFGTDEVRAGEVFEGVKRLLKRHMFKGECPKCHGAKCGECKGQGWVTFGMWAEMRARRADR